MTDQPDVAIVDARKVDVGDSREASRRRRLWMLALVLGLPAAFLWFRIMSGSPFDVFSLPSIDPIILMQVLIVGSIVGTTGFMFLGGSKSPHVVYRPEQIDVTIDDIKGIDVVKEDVIRSLNMFLAHKTFSAQTGGAPRRGLLFEGSPGTGKTHMAKAMAREAGVPFLYVSATSFQSQMYGATARKIRAYFKALRKAARQEGGAIGFIEEIDAIGMARGGLSATAMPEVARSSGVAGMPMCCGGLVGLPTGYQGAWSSAGIVSNAAGSLSHAPGSVRNASMVSEGTGGVVNELLVQMQSFDEPAGRQKMQTKLVDWANLFLPAGRQLTRPRTPPTNLLLIAATNRADNLDPALLRPGRFDRRLTFESPTKAGRRDLIDLFLDRRNHDAELDDAEQRDAIAAATPGYTPVMLEHLLDEALVNAIRRGETALNRADIESARMVEEVGLGQPVAYTSYEKRLIATHEAGHATIAYLVAPERRLEILTIVKRRDALGMLAHNDKEDVFTRSRQQMLNFIEIAFGGQVAEELFFGDVSTGPGGDLLYATNIASQMVGAAGMTGSLISFGAVENSGFSDTNLVGRVLGDPAGRAKVEEILQQQKVRAHETLGANRHLLEALRDALLERHELIGSEITDVLDAARAAGPRAAGPLAAAPRADQHEPTSPEPPRRTRSTSASPPSTAAPRPTRLQRGTPPVDDLGVDQVIEVSRAGAGTASEPSDVPVGHPTSVVVRFGGARYAVAMAAVAEVVPVPVLTRVPGVSRWLAGVVNWRGRVLPVIDPRSLLGEDLNPLPSSARLLVLALDGVEAGVLAEAVSGLLEAGDGMVQPSPATAPSSAAALVLGTVNDATGPLSLLDPVALLALRSQLRTNH